MRSNSSAERALSLVTTSRSLDRRASSSCAFDGVACCATAMLLSTRLAAIVRFGLSDGVVDRRQGEIVAGKDDDVGVQFLDQMEQLFLAGCDVLDV